MSPAVGTAPSGLELPFLTDADPDLLGEGSLDPLGLGRFAERLAESLLPDMTARMQRVHFLTAIAVGAVILEGLEDVSPTDRVTPPSVALEWVVVEAFARNRSLPALAVQGLPGIDKARAVVTRQGHLDSRSYLRAPKVFGFFGVYKRLAVGLGLIDDQFLLGAKGDELVRAWERDELGQRAGLADRLASRPGGNLLRALNSATSRALLRGQVAVEPGSHLWGATMRAFRLDEIGREERRLLWRGLQDPLKPHRQEMMTLIRRHDPGGTEAEALFGIRPYASAGLGRCLDAIDAFERVARLLTHAFSSILVISTAEGWVTPAQVSTHTAIRRCASQVPDALRRAVDRAEQFGFAYELTTHIETIAEAGGPADLVERLVAHHEQVQANKPPGRRPWFLRSERGFRVRPPYFRDNENALPGFIHPYRINALRRFIGDLR